MLPQRRCYLNSYPPKFSYEFLLPFDSKTLSTLFLVSILVSLPLFNASTITNHKIWFTYTTQCHSSTTFSHTGNDSYYYASNLVNGLSVIEKAKAINDLFEVILSNGFPRLRICTAVGIEPLDFNEKWTGSSSIRVLLLDGQRSLVDEKLAVLCPHLRQPKRLVETSIDPQIDLPHREDG